MSSCRVHNVRFYNLEPKSATCLCYEPGTKKLALSRTDNSIEIWNVANAPFIESVIAGSGSNSVESMLWIGARLFSTGLNGSVIEYDLKKHSIKYKTSVTGGAAWCMDANPQQTKIAVGTEDGYVNLFTVADDSLIYERIFDKQNGRIMCLKWDRSGDSLFTGSSDTVRVWNAISGHAVHRMLTSRKETRKETIIWCLAVTEDNVVVSGDSRGVISFWDPVMGTLIESYESHTADVLAMTMSHDLNVLYCAGVDPVVRSFTRVTMKNSGRAQWVKGIERRLHSHDVRALVDADGKLYSAGVDGYLAQSSYPPKVLVKYPPLLQPPAAILCPKSRCVLLRHSNYLELWRLGSANKPNLGAVRPGTLHQLDEEPIKLLHLKTKGEENIISCAISRDSKTIVYSTDSNLRVFNFDVIEGEAQLTKNVIDAPLKRVQKMLFSPNGKFFVTVSNDDGGNVVTIFDVSAKNLRYKRSFNAGEQKIEDVGLTCFSPDSQYLVCADFSGHIAVYKVGDKDKQNSTVGWSLPKYTCPPTALAVQQGTLNLVIVYSDHKILEYNIPRRQYTEFSNNLQSRLPLQWLARPFPITNVLFDPNDENIILMHDDSTIYIINKNKEMPEKSKKIPRRENGDTTEDSSSGSLAQMQHLFQAVKKYKHLVHFEWLNKEELVAVELDPTSLTEKLPFSLKQKWFGV